MSEISRLTNDTSLQRANAYTYQQPTSPLFNLLKDTTAFLIYGRKLRPDEYTLHKDGSITFKPGIGLNDKIGIAYQYECGGRVFQVGEFDDQVPNTKSKLLFLKRVRIPKP